MTLMVSVLMFLIAVSPLQSRTGQARPSRGAMLFPIGQNNLTVSDLSISVFSDLALTEYVIVNPGKAMECRLALECLPSVGTEPGTPASLDGVLLTCNEKPVTVTYSSRAALEEQLKIRLPSFEGASILHANVVLKEWVNRLSTAYRLPALQGDDAMGILYRTISLRNADQCGRCTPRFTVRFYPDYDLPFAASSGGDSDRWVVHTDGPFGKHRTGPGFMLRNGFVELQTESAPLPRQIQFSFPSAGSAPALDRFYNSDGDPLISSCFTLRSALVGQEWNAALAGVRQGLAGFSKEQLRFLRNLVYAFYGYEFKDPEVLRQFGTSCGYVVDPLHRQGAIRFKEQDSVMVELLAGASGQ